MNLSYFVLLLIYAVLCVRVSCFPFYAQNLRIEMNDKQNSLAQNYNI